MDLPQEVGHIAYKLKLLKMSWHIRGTIHNYFYCKSCLEDSLVLVPVKENDLTMDTLKVKRNID